MEPFHLDEETRCVKQKNKKKANFQNFGNLNRRRGLKTELNRVKRDLYNSPNSLDPTSTIWLNELRYLWYKTKKESS
jgi:hypothetical protein